jgi:hypothetical protein
MKRARQRALANRRIKMVNKQSFSVIAFGILIIALAFLLLNPLASLQAPSISLGAADTTVSARLSNIERSAAATVARWEAMGKHFANLASARPETANIADQARWDAVGEFYIPTSARPEAANIADQARWEAAGEFYASPTSSRAEEAISADQVRWEAVGEFYTGRARTADQARWEAAGEFYTDRGRSADQARWDAMGEAYGKMIGSN